MESILGSLTSNAAVQSGIVNSCGVVNSYLSATL